MSKKTEALKRALEALEETRNALAWFYDSYPQDVTQRGSKLLPHVETVLTDIREALAEQPAQPGRCHLCDCTGDIHSPDGEWRGACPHCNQPEKLEPVAHIPDEALEQLKPPMRILRGVPLYGYAGVGTTAVYTAPPQRKPLTDEQWYKVHRAAWEAFFGCALDSVHGQIQCAAHAAMRATEAAHGIKGGAS